MNWKFIKENENYYYLQFDDLLFCFDKKTDYFALISDNPFYVINRGIDNFLNRSEVEIEYNFENFHQYALDIKNFMNIRLLYKYIMFLKPFYYFEAEEEFLKNTRFYEIKNFK